MKKHKDQDTKSPMKDQKRPQDYSPPAEQDKPICPRETINSNNFDKSELEPTPGLSDGSFDEQEYEEEALLERGTMRDTTSHLIELENILELPNESGSEADNEFMMHAALGSPSSSQRLSYHPGGGSSEFYLDHYYDRDEEANPKKRKKKRSRKEEGQSSDPSKGKDYKRLNAEESSRLGNWPCWFFLLLLLAGGLFVAYRYFYVDQLSPVGIPIKTVGRDAAKTTTTTQALSLAQTSSKDQGKSAVLPPLPPPSFVYEIARHGARAPYKMNLAQESPSRLSEVHHQFANQSDGQLTPVGMRQRYLLGRVNVQKWFGNSSDLSGVCGQIVVKSTPLTRTLQSAYSELLAFSELYAKSCHQEIYRPATRVKKQAQVPFKTRRKPQLEQLFQKTTFPPGFIALPVYTEKDSLEFSPGVSIHGCAKLQANDRKQEDAAAKNTALPDAPRLNEAVHNLRPILEREFNLTRDQSGKLSIDEAGNLADLLISVWRQTKNDSLLTPAERELVLGYNQVWVEHKFKGYFNLYGQFLLEGPLKDIEQLIKGGSQVAKKYTLVSGHDSQLTVLNQVLTGISPTKGLPYADFASSFKIEVHILPDPVVRLLQNGKPVTLSACGKEACSFNLVKQQVLTLVGSGNLESKCRI